MSAPATPEMRDQVHAVLDPLWEQATVAGGYEPKRLKYMTGGVAYSIRKVARERVYAWLAEQMWLTESQCHVAKFSAEQCAEALELLSQVTYAEIRTWAHNRGARTDAQTRASRRAKEQRHEG